MTRRIGIKRRWWFGYRWYEVENFYFRSGVASYIDRNTPARAPLPSLWLVLQFKTHDLIITDIERRGYIAYPEPKSIPPVESEESQNGLSAPALGGAVTPGAVRLGSDDSPAAESVG